MVDVGENRVAQLGGLAVVDVEPVDLGQHRARLRLALAERSECHAHVLGVVDMVVRVEVSRCHDDGRTRLAGRGGAQDAGDGRQVERLVVLDVALVGRHLVGWEADGSADLGVKDEPAGVGPHERVLAALVFSRADAKVAVGAQPLEAGGPGAHGDLLAKAWQPVDLDFPGADHPCAARLAHVLGPHAHVLGVEGAAILQVVHERGDTEDTSLVYLAEPDPAREGVHTPSPPRVCRSCRPPGPRDPLATEEIVPVGRLPSPGWEGAAVQGVALAPAQV